MNTVKKFALAALAGLSLADCGASAAAGPRIPVAAQSGKLTGPRWAVETIGGVAAVGRTRPYLQFGADGRFSGSSGCNGVMGGYAVSGSAVSLRRVATTRIGCFGTLKDQERRFVAILNAVKRFEIGPDGALVLTTERGDSIRAVPAR